MGIETVALYFNNVSPGPSESELYFCLIQEAENGAKGHCDPRVHLIKLCTTVRALRNFYATKSKVTTCAYLWTMTGSGSTFMRILNPTVDSGETFMVW
ncbi:hypothetical protein N665_0183s0029 [Sinapis alba]|nr:hypothetical protein N665_0183s0029 [Sinapis alba]